MLLTVPQAATLLAVSPDTVRELARGGKIPAAKVGKAWRFDRNQLLAHFASGAVHKAKRIVSKVRIPWAVLQKYAERIELGISVESRKEPTTKPPSEITYSALRLRLLRKATPPWADRKAIAEIYRQARFLSLKTKIKHHVDHIIPLQGRTVCGLHVETNLRVVTWHENVRRPRVYVPE